MGDTKAPVRPTPVEMKTTKAILTPDIPKIFKNVTPKLFIDGEYVEAASKKTFPVVDPRTAETVLQVSEADAADVDIAVKAALKAFEEGPWPKKSARERGRLLHKLADFLEENQEELALLETMDTGKPITISRSVDIPYGIAHIRYFASYADKIYGKTIPVDGEFLCYTLREPIGVVGAITPWNFPFAMMSWKIGPALAAGNCVVLKPAEQTPLTALKTAELAVKAGIPPGVFNVLPGYGPTAGAALVKHLDVGKIAFTGSTEVGQLIMGMAAGNVKNVSLELGGKSPCIIFPDADIDQAVEQACNSVFFNQGQCCDSPSRLFVHADVFDEVVKKAAEIASKRKVGDPFNEVDQGPQIDEDQFNKVLSYIKSGKDQGAELVCGGCPIGDKGFYIEPTVFANVKDEMKISQEEIFGPVQSIFKFHTTEEVIKRANCTNYGLASAVYTSNLNTANQVSRGIKAGTVWVNCYQVSDHATPFGGYKMSGIGRDRGEESIYSYTQVKTITTALKDPAWI